MIGSNKARSTTNAAPRSRALHQPCAQRADATLAPAIFSRTGACVRTRAEAGPARAGVLDELQPVDWRKVVGTANERLRALHSRPKWTPAHALVERDPGAKSVRDARATCAAIDGDVVPSCAGWLRIPAGRGTPWLGARGGRLKVLCALIAGWACGSRDERYDGDNA